MESTLNPARPFLVSLTSYPPRFETLKVTLDSLASQRVQPVRTMLNIAAGDYVEFLDVTGLDHGAASDLGLTINVCADLGPAKKLLPTLVMHPDLPIITVDDDIAYGQGLTMALMVQHLMFPKAIIGNRTRRIAVNSTGAIEPYSKWALDDEGACGPAANIFPTGAGGTLYPPGCMHSDALREDVYCALAFHTDDIWWYFQARRQGTLFRRTPIIEPYSQTGGTKESGLWLTGNRERNNENFALLQSLYGSPLEC